MRPAHAVAARALALAGGLSLAAALAGFTADVSRPIGTELYFPLLDCVGSGHAALALRADYQQHLAMTQRDIGFRHIRGHGSLDDDMSAFLNGHANMYNLFRAFDFFLSVGIRPILELSFMPDDLAFDPSKTIMHYRGGTSAPKSLDSWGQFISEVAQLLVDRYGVDELRRWRFEVWNEPGSCGFYCPKPGDSALSSYLGLYNATSRALRAVDPLLSVGGPATAELGWVAEFINATRDGAMPASFLSTHSYPTDYAGDPSVTRTSFEEHLYEVAATAAAAGLPFVMTEASAGWQYKAYDAPFAGAWVAHQAAAFLGVANVPTISYWTFSDIFEEPGMDSTPYAETFGLISKWGVPKPAYRAFEFVSALPPTGLPVVVSSGPAAPPKHAARAGPAAAATATSGTVDIITAIDASLGTTTSLHALVVNYNSNIKDQEDPSAGLPISAENVTLTFANLPAISVVDAFATVSLVDSKSWGKAQWIKNGSPTYPTAAQIASELQASLPARVSVPVAVAGGAATVALPQLEPYAVAYVRLEFASSAA